MNTPILASRRRSRGRWAGRLVAGLLALAMQAAQAAGPDYPTKPIRVVVPYAPGGPTDVLARVLLKDLSASLGQPLVIDNKAGASGMIGAEAVARAEPDGHTLLFNPSIHAIYPSVYRSMRYDAQKDFAPVSQLADVPMLLLVPSDSTARTAGELIAQVKASKRPVNFGSSGTAGAPHLASELFKQLTGIEATHVAYKGSGPALTDLAARQLDFMIDPLPSSMPLIKSGRVRALAVTTRARQPALPDVPTLIEAGVAGYDVSTWYGVWAPAGTPPAIVDKLSIHIARALAKPAIRQQLTDLGAVPVGSSPADFTRFVASETTRWKHVVDAAGVKGPE